MVMNKYDYQKDLNIHCLLEDQEYSERETILWKIVDRFSEAGIQYGIGCSCNLFLRGIVDEFHDFDLIIEEESIGKANRIMLDLGAKLLATGGNGFCESNYYFHYQIGRVDIDIISGFRLKTFEKEYLYEVNSKELDFVNIYKEKGRRLPLIPMENMYILYHMMEGWQKARMYKRILIREYLKNDNVSYRNILEDALKLDLPNVVKNGINEILNSVRI